MLLETMTIFANTVVGRASTLQQSVVSDTGRVVPSFSRKENNSCFLASINFLNSELGIYTTENDT